MDKFNKVLTAIKEAHARAKDAQKRQEQVNKELVRKWRELTNRHTASYSRSPGLLA